MNTPMQIGRTHVDSGPYAPWQKYMQLGIVHFMIYPQLLKGDGPIVETARKIATDPFFEVLEVGLINNAADVPALKALAGEYTDPPDAPFARLDAAADQHFFPHLWEHLDEDRDAACLSWQTFLRDQAHDLLETALATAAPGAALRWKRIAAATSLFWHGLYKAFPDLKPDRPDPVVTSPLADPA